METSNDSFWQFSDQLRVQTNNSSNTILSLNNDSIWSASYSSKTPRNRRNFNLTVGSQLNNSQSDFNAVNDAWKIGINSAFHNSTITYPKTNRNLNSLLRKICEPLEEDSFRPTLHHYDGPKFRLELSIPEALSLLDIFEESLLNEDKFAVQ